MCYIYIYIHTIYIYIYIYMYICIYVCMYIVIIGAAGAGQAAWVIGERGSAPKGGRHSSMCFDPQ